MSLANCPWCGGSTAMASAMYVYCLASECSAAGPSKDPTGSKWNALCARLLPPDCVAVPVAKLEAIRPLAERAYVYVPEGGRISGYVSRAVTIDDKSALDALLSHLPPRVDHVAVLRNLRNHVETRPTRQRDIEAEKAALEAAIAALEKDGR